MTLDPTGPDLESFRSDLLEFYAGERRDLPWRRDPDPYRVLVSEVMLQQTRVETVIPYFERWMERFPDPAALADAEIEEVLRVWQGLGYYSRARHLHRAVREVRSRYGGRVPSDPGELKTLPGVGPYTAGAVASIAFGVAAPAVDGNVRRVLARLKDDPAPSPAQLRDWATALVDPDRPGAFNQALMDLGSTVCTPRSPGCGRCPVTAYCLARERGTQEIRPRPKRRAAPPHVVEAVAVVRVRAPAGDLRVLLRRRPMKGLLGGMWELPGERVEGTEEAREVAGRLAGALARAVEAAGSVEPERDLEPIDHAFSHLRITYRPHLFSVEREGPGSIETEPELRWVSDEGLEELPLPAAQIRILSLLS